MSDLKTDGSEVNMSGPEDRSTMHCDDYIDDESVPLALRTFLRWARSPGHGLTSPRPWPKLFADYRGSRVRVTMASRLGDVGVTSDLHAEVGYQRRGVTVFELSNFSDELCDPYRPLFVGK